MALSTAKLKDWLAADLSGLDLLAIQIDGLRVGDHVLVAAIGIDGVGDNHVLALALGATENAAVVKALLADLIERGLRPLVHRRRCQGAEPGRARYLRWLRADPALPGTQGTQHHRAARFVVARRGQEGAASGLGQPDR